MCEQVSKAKCCLSVLQDRTMFPSRLVRLHHLHGFYFSILFLLWSSMDCRFDLSCLITCKWSVIPHFTTEGLRRVQSWLGLFRLCLRRNRACREGVTTMERTIRTWERDGPRLVYCTQVWGACLVVAASRFASPFPHSPSHGSYYFWHIRRSVPSCRHPTLMHFAKIIITS